MIKKVLCTLSCFFLIWVFSSFIDVNLHNTSDRDYACWNCISMFFDIEKTESQQLITVSSKSKNKAKAIKKKQVKKAKKIKKIKKRKHKLIKHYTKKNVILLAKLIQAENGGAKHDETLYLTGAVVMKRVKSRYYPNTIRKVIYQKGQYSTSNRLHKIRPNERCLEIAGDILRNGVDDLPDNLVFQSLFFQGRKLYKKIDGEYFCLA